MKIDLLLVLFSKSLYIPIVLGNILFNFNFIIRKFTLKTAFWDVTVERTYVTPR